MHGTAGAQAANKSENSIHNKSIDATNDCFSKALCPYFFDLYKKNDRFKKILNSTLSNEKIPIYKWIASGVSNPALPLNINGKRYLYLSNCKPHDCSANALDIIYNEKDGYVKGIIKLDDQALIIGDLDDNELSSLAREANRYGEALNLSELSEKNIRKRIIASGCQGLADVPIGLQMRALKDCEENRSVDPKNVSEDKKEVLNEKRSRVNELGRERAVVTPDGRVRFALVIGNSAYSNLPKLPNTINDARSITQSLQQAGFSVMTAENLDLGSMQNAIRSFGEKLKKNDVGLFYYAGHAVQVKGKNYLIPVKENIKKSFEVPASAVDVDLVLATLESVKNDLNIVILDSCRSSFPGEARGATRGLATIEAAKGTFIAFATAPGKEALDGTGSNSPYTKHLSRLIGQKGLQLEQVFKEVRKAVVAETNGEQVPWENSSLMGDFYFTK